MLNIIQVRNDLLSKLSIEDASLADSLTIQDVLIAINGALQVLQTAGQDFFTRQIITVEFGAGTAALTLSRSVQAVLGPMRWNDDIPLRALTSRGELDQFTRIFLGGTLYGAGLGTPMAYFVENLRDGNSGDIDQINVFLAPKPDEPGELVIEVIPDSPAYTSADFQAGTAILPVAQNYTESVFLPIARMMVTRSRIFSRPDIVPQLQTDYDRAMQTLADVGGFPNAVQPSPPREVEA
jgi:hypothetical protein